jgi:hypothetical protein
MWCWNVRRSGTWPLLSFELYNVPFLQTLPSAFKRKIPSRSASNSISMLTQPHQINSIFIISLLNLSYRRDASLQHGVLLVDRLHERVARGQCQTGMPSEQQSMSDAIGRAATPRSSNKNIWKSFLHSTMPPTLSSEKRNSVS